MSTFEQFNISNPLSNAIGELGYTSPTPIQSASFSTIQSGKDVVGVSQTGTGKTLAYMLPILNQLKYSDQINPRVLIMVPTRELVVQVVEQIESYTKYMNTRVLGVYGGANINKQKLAVGEGVDILVATPGRLYDLTLSRSVQLKSVTKLVIDEVDEMLDLGFRFQLTNIFDLLPEKRQNIMFSATMTDDVDALIDDFFILPEKISTAVSGTPLSNINQISYNTPNFYTKINLLNHLLSNTEEFQKVLVFISKKKSADHLMEADEYSFSHESVVIHGNKSQNHRLAAVQDFDIGNSRVLIATDLISRGLDFDKISHVINFDTPAFPENYMHRIGRTGRAKELGNSILFFANKEEENKIALEVFMGVKIPVLDIPNEVTISKKMAPEDSLKERGKHHERNSKLEAKNSGFHEKKAKNSKVNLGGSYKRIVAEKYKKPKTRGDKNQNLRNKKKR